MKIENHLNVTFAIIPVEHGLKNNLGVVHKLRLQEEGVGGQKNRLFVNIYTIENVNGGGWVVKKRQIL